MKSKWFVLMLVMVFGVTLLFTACGDDNDADSPQPIIVLGDSLSSGWNTVQSTPTVDTLANAWPATFEKWVNVPVINVSRNGNFTTEALNDLNSKVLARNPQIVVIQLGANDFFEIDLAAGDPAVAIGAGIENIRANIASIINQLDNGERKIYVAKWYNQTVAEEWVANNAPPLAPMIPTLLGMFDQAYASLAQGKDNVTLMAQDVWANGVWDNHRDWDRIHPLASGCVVMAGTYFDAMKAYLNEKDLLSAAGKAKL